MEDLTGASGNARGGLSALGNFLVNLQKWKVEKPKLLAETDETKARTGSALELTEAAKQRRLEAERLAPGILTQQRLATGALERESAGQVKQLYLSQVQPSEIRAGLVDAPWHEAVAGGHVPSDTVQALAESGGQHPVTWPAPSVSPEDIMELRVQDVLRSAPPGSAPITRAEAMHALVMEEYSRRAALRPPVSVMNPPPGMAVTEVTGGEHGIGFKATRPGAYPIPATDSSGNPTGGLSGFTQVGGEIKPSPISPEKVMEKQAALTDMRSSMAQVQEIQKILTDHSELIGPVGGSEPIKFARHVGAALGLPTNYSNQIKLNQFLQGQVITMLSKIHIGRVTQLEFTQLQQQLPTQTSPADVWEPYMARLHAAMVKTYDDDADALRTAGVPAAKLPAIEGFSSSKVVRPKPSTSSMRTIKPGQQNTVRPGEQFIWEPDGQVYAK